MGEELDLNILSQDEVDALLKAVDSGDVVFSKEENKKVCVTYDFRNPVLIPKEVVRILKVIHENFARNTSLSLSAFLRSRVSIELISVDQLTYNEFMLSLPNVTYLNVVSLAPLKGNVIMEINANMALLFIERLLGGESKKQLKARALTELEMGVANRVVARILREYALCWKYIIEFNPRVENRSSDPRFTQICKPEDTVLLVCFDVKMGESSGILNICFPLNVLEPLVELIVQMRKKKIFQNEDGLLSQMQKTLLDIPVRGKVELDRFKLSFEEVLSLAEGDVIRLSRKIIEGADLFVDKKSTARVDVMSYKQRMQAVVREKYRD